MLGLRRWGTPCSCCSRVRSTSGRRDRSSCNSNPPGQGRIRRGSVRRTRHWRKRTPARTSCSFSGLRRCISCNAACSCCRPAPSQCCFRSSNRRNRRGRSWWLSSDTCPGCTSCTNFALSRSTAGSTDGTAGTRPPAGRNYWRTMPRRCPPGSNCPHRKLSRLN